MSVAARRNGLDALLADPRLWRGSGGRSAAARISSNHSALDAALGGGWPRGVVCELALAAAGCGELTLLLPVLRQLDGMIALIAPPHVPYPAAFAAAGVNLANLLLVHPADPGEAQWAAEQTLRGATCAAVLLWLPSIGPRAVRRLQLAAEASGAFMALLLPQAGSPAHSPAALRLQIDSAPQGVAVRVRKRRGGWPGPALTVENPSRAVVGADLAAAAAGGAADSG